MASGVNITRALASLRAIPLTVQAAATRALSELAPDLEGELRATDVHGDVTGATRASYRVYVVSDIDDGSNAAAAGAAAAEALNPGHGTVERHGSIGDDVVLVASAFTDYAEILADSAGARDAVTPLMQRAGPVAAQAVAQAIARRLGGG